MNVPTPDQQRKIDQAVRLFKEGWYADFATKEIRRKPVSNWRSAVEIFWKRRHPVFAMYWWAKHRFSEPQGMTYAFPLHHDNMPIKGFPVKYELQGGWTIPSTDLKYLMKGPLASEGLAEILVPHALGWERFLLFLKQFGPLVASAIMILGASIRWWPELVKLWAWFKDAI